jgi:hypothetical protein
MTKIAGPGSASRSGSICQRHGSADQDPDPPQNVMDPQHRFKNSRKKATGHHLKLQQKGDWPPLKIAAKRPLATT